MTKNYIHLFSVAVGLLPASINCVQKIIIIVPFNNNMMRSRPDTFNPNMGNLMGMYMLWHRSPFIFGWWASIVHMVHIDPMIWKAIPITIASKSHWTSGSESDTARHCHTAIQKSQPKIKSFHFVCLTSCTIFHSIADYSRSRQCSIQFFHHSWAANWMAGCVRVQCWHTGAPDAQQIEAKSQSDQ